MHPAIVAASLALAAASAMAGYVAMRREKTQLHWLLLAVFGSLMVWTTGTIVRFSVQTPEGLAAALRVVFLGVFATPPLWLLLAVCYARPGLFARQPRWAALMLPSLLAYLGLLTNEAHGLMLRGASFEALEAGGVAWAGPAFWAFLAWAHVCVLGGAGVYLHTAQRLLGGAERRRGIVLAVAALFPLAASSVYLFRLLPVRFDLTPAALTLSLLLLCVAVFRYQLLESLPLARRHVIEHLRQGVVMASPSGAILDVNPAAESVLGGSEADLRRRPLASVVAELAREDQRADVRRGLEDLESGAPPRVMEFQTADDRCIELSAAWVRAGRGTAAGRFVVLSDRTENRRVERLVRHTQRLKTVGTLASGIAHEVNNPLAFIRANLTEIRRMGELVETQSATGFEGKLGGELEDLAQIADETLDGIERIERIVTGMRRLASGRDECLRPVDVNEIVRDALRLANLNSDPNVSLVTRLGDALPAVDAAPERLVQALLNLLVNARQALEGRSGHICVETQQRGHQLEIRVSDDGPGIPDELRERVFDPFFTTRDPDQGTGLGLAIAFDILRDHGGSLEVASARGPGACFVARLPAAG